MGRWVSDAMCMKKKRSKASMSQPAAPQQKQNGPDDTPARPEPQVPGAKMQGGGGVVELRIFRSPRSPLWRILLGWWWILLILFRRISLLILFKRIRLIHQILILRILRIWEGLTD